MKRLAPVLLVIQVAVAFIGAKSSPDYYVRSSASVLQWAYSKGLWVLLTNLALSIVLGIIVRKNPSRTRMMVLVVSIVLTSLWFVFPYAYSLLGDIAFWRFP